VEAQARILDPAEGVSPSTEPHDDKLDDDLDHRPDIDEYHVPAGHDHHHVDDRARDDDIDRAADYDHCAVTVTWRQEFPEKFRAATPLAAPPAGLCRTQKGAPRSRRSPLLHGDGPLLHSDGIACLWPGSWQRGRRQTLFTLVVVISALGGLAVGSFLNVVIYRVPIGKSIVSPPSACPGCGAAVSPQDNIPMLSWVLLRGRCRHCRTPISIRYPIVEALTAVLFALTAVRLGPSWSLPAELAFVGGIVALAAVDLERYLLPRAILYPTLALVGALLVVAAAVTGRWGRLGVAVVCSAAAFLTFFAIHFVRPRWLGFGDVRLAALLGLALGWMGPWYLVVAFLAANLIGAIVGVGLMIVGKASRTTALPYGVFLGVGSIFALLLAGPIISWYSHHLAR
jgi:leader peptidase (prepilin peptidase)/N-methyltransferase